MIFGVISHRVRPISSNDEHLAFCDHRDSKVGKPILK